MEVLTSTLPAPLGSSMRSPLVFVVLSVFPLRSRLSTLRLSILLDASVIIPLDAVSVPGV